MTQHIYDIAHITDCHDTNPEGGHLAATKVELAYSVLARKFGLQAGLIRVVPAEEFNTIDVGAKFSELATSSLDPHGLLIAINAAPPSIPNGNNNNARKNFVLGRLKNGVVFGGTWGGHCLSYVKSQIVELHELLDSNNGSQFRSLDVLPSALVTFANNTIDQNRLSPVTDISTQVPDVPGHSHAWTIDNFGNIKLYLTNHDRGILETAHTKNETIRFAFGQASLEFGLPNEQPARGSFHPAGVFEKLFSAETGATLLSLTSSAKVWDRNGGLLPVAQIATIRRQPNAARGYALPPVGAPLYLSI